jgi:hypothetical protein
MSELAAPPALEFTVAGAEPIEHAATPGVRFHVLAEEPEGREVYAVALTVQIQIDPALRIHGDEERARLVELFGPPERWASTTRALQWARVEALVPSFSSSATFSLEVPCTYDLEVVSAKYFDALDDGEVPLTFHFNGTVLYRGPDDRLQVVLVPWSCSVRWRMPVAVWKRTIASHYPGGGWVRLQRETLEALARRSPRCSTRAISSIRIRRTRPRTSRRRRSASSTRRSTRPARRTRSTARGCSSCSSPAKR